MSLRRVAVGTALTFLFNIINPSFAVVETLFKKEENRTQITFINEASASERRLEEISSKKHEPLESMIGSEREKIRENLVVAQATTVPETTYKVIFPFKEPSSNQEKMLLETTDVITYMNSIRTKADVKWAISLTHLVNQSLNPSQWKDFLKKNKVLGDLTPYIPIKDIMKYQQSKTTFQGTHVPAKPVFYQETLTGELIPLDISKMGLHKRKTEIIQPTERKEKGYNGLIAFVSDKEGNDEICTIDPITKRVKNLTNHPSDDVCPSWSLDGKEIVFVSDRKGGRGAYGLSNNTGLYIMNNDGSNTRKLTFGKSKRYFPVWSPDGKNIVYSAKSAFIPHPGPTDLKLFIIKPDSLAIERSNPKRLTKSGMIGDPRWIECYPSFPLEGGRLAFYREKIKRPFSRKEDKQREIVIMDFQKRKILSRLDVAHTSYPVFSPDGSKLLVLDYRRNGLYLCNIKVGKLEKTKEVLLPHAVEAVSWSPDGNKIAFVASSKLYQMNKDQSDLEILVAEDVEGYGLNWQSINKDTYRVRLESIEAEKAKIRSVVQEFVEAVYFADFDKMYSLFTYFEDKGSLLAKKKAMKKKEYGYLTEDKSDNFKGKVPIEKFREIQASRITARELWKPLEEKYGFIGLEEKCIEDTYSIKIKLTGHKAKYDEKIDQKTTYAIPSGFDLFFRIPPAEFGIWVSIEK